MKNLLGNVKIDVVEVGATSGTSQLTSDSVDMTNFEGVAFVGRLATHDDTGTGDNVNDIRVEQSDDDSVWEDLPTARAIPSADNGLGMVDLYRPTKRYVRCKVNRATASVTGDVLAIRYCPRKAPVTEDAGDARTIVASAAAS